MSRKRLIKEDYAFIELIQEEISDYCAIPLSLNVDRIKGIMIDTAKYFYEWHPQGCQRVSYLINYQEIKNARNGGFASKVKIPESIKFVYRIRRGSGGGGVGKLASYLRDPMSGMNRFMGSMNSFNTSIGGGQGNNTAMEHIISLYEYQTINSVSSGGRGVANDFNEFTNEITFLSDVDCDLVLEVGVRVPIHSLYSDRMYKEYVKGKALESLGRVIGTYDYKYVGNVTVNWSDFKSDGKEMWESIRDELKGMNSGSFIISGR